jgi:hypothetical protein
MTPPHPRGIQPGPTGGYGLGPERLLTGGSPCAARAIRALPSGCFGGI